ncbi:hypothetical protein [Halobaculum lipolyticum]|uniref:Integral membrane protein n=1 Tax=Halobaculum lipolyticum TaxID=3032001 RepID=A0ABD5W5Q9_9EURY|nr:hypothetical protein [Halobaculum sp. DT31]
MSAVIRLLAVALVGGTVAAGVVAVRRRDVSATVNAAFSLTVATLPFALPAFVPGRVAEAVAAVPELSLWFAAAGFLHVLGMLGWYDTVWWWDHLTHSVSSALLAALVYAALVVVGRVGPRPVLPGATLAVVAVGFVFAVGVFWELFELLARDLSERLDVDPVLVHYGWRDTGFDLVFDTLGALLVVAADLRVFVPVAAGAPDATRTALVWSGWAVVAGSAVMTAYLLVGWRIGTRGRSDG